jgi:flagellar assembly protein FliH
MIRRAALADAKRYLFERGFHAPAGDEAAEAATFSLGDVERARAEGRAEGRADALAEAERSDQRRIATASEAIVAALADAHGEFESMRAHGEASAIGVAAAIVRKMLPELYRREGASEIVAMVTALLPSLVDSPKLTIRLNGDECERLTQPLQAAAAATGFDGRLLILTDAGVAGGDCRIEWTNGGASRDGTRLWQDIEMVLADALPMPGAKRITDQPAAESAPRVTNGGEHV